MNQGDIQKLLGGYATGTLTPEEQQLLFEAALDDQELFDALAREQALRDLLRDPGAKAQLLAALDDRPSRWYEKFAWWRPTAAVLAMAGVSALAVIALRRPTPTQPVLTAQVSPAPASSNPVAEDSRMPKIVAPNPAQVPATPALPATPRTTSKDEEVKPANPPEIAAAENRLGKLKQEETDELKRRKDQDVVRSFNAPLPQMARQAVSPFREGPAVPKPGSGLGGAIGGAPATLPAPATAPPPPPAKEGAAQQSAGTLGSIAGVAPAGQQQAPAPSQALQQAQQSVTVTASPQAEVLAGAAALAGIPSQNARDLFYADTAVSTGTLLDGKGKSLEPAAKKAEQNEKVRTETSALGNAAAPADKAVQALDRLAKAANPGVRYTLLRRGFNGQFAQVDAESLKTGDVVKLQFEPNDSGNLLVRELTTDGAWKNVISTRVEKRQTYPTRPLSANVNQVQVTFVPSNVRVNNAAMKRAGSQGRVSMSQQSTNEPATYVVGDPTTAAVSFTITLNYK